MTVLRVMRNMRLLRDVRAVLTSAVLWAAGWATIGAAVRVLRIAWRSGPFPDVPHLLRLVIAGAGMAAVWGAIAGTGFAALLLARRRWRGHGAPSMSRWLLWGAAAGAAVPGLAAAITTLRSGTLSPVEAWWVVFPIVGAATAGLLGRVAGAPPALTHHPEPSLVGAEDPMGRERTTRAYHERLTESTAAWSQAKV